jgi:2-aminoadipate transaminase
VSEGVLYVPGSYSYAEEPGPVPKNHARLCFGVAGEDDLYEGIRRLSVALAGCLDPVV